MSTKRTSSIAPDGGARYGLQYILPPDGEICNVHYQIFPANSQAQENRSQSRSQGPYRRFRGTRLEEEIRTHQRKMSKDAQCFGDIRQSMDGF
ncbi:hypothetical protein TWF225_006459 [Orbilia oligospora]|nr:hypothetical protein TWF225_006459 [Orbilia oligospora]KAF3256313.1 hypothetical protein TWF128_005378 [Orbilia oligospora]KAF3261859.1 hypothetical protein TWF217_004423 [Orbilia oligospora]KAF3298429.1 hypothetical protein TWF132_000248 [Orbilia oligospora]